MIGSTRSVSVFAYGQPVDMRRSFDGLSCLVTQSLSLDVLSGDLYLFVSRNRKRAKVLFWDGTGLCVYGKRLERGRFTAVWSSPEEVQLKLTMTELQLFLEGTELLGRLPLSPAPYDYAAPLFPR
jgi:transposase